MQFYDELWDALSTEAVVGVLSTIWGWAYLWAPVLLIMGWFKIHLTYKQRKFIKDQGGTLLEIRLPRELPRSPQSMEMFLNNLYQNSAGHLLKVYAEGSVRPWFSLELVSIEGAVHFYIWTHNKFRKMVETQLYAQFPGIEVHEVPDYTLGVHHDPDKLNFGWIGQFALTKKDAYPIMTYIDYGLDKDPKEEFKHDPIVAVLEYLGSLGRGEQAWIQIMVQAHTKEGLKLGRIITKPDWKAEAKKEMESIADKALLKPKEGDFKMTAILTKGEQETISAIERSLNKWAFDTMIRATYFAENGTFDPNNIGGLLGSFRQFSSNTLNGLKPDFKAGKDYPWQDFQERGKMRDQRKLLEAYKRRSFFNTPFKNFKGKPFILTTEELATLYHFPSSEVAATPTLTRIPSKKSEAPSNLPI